MRFFDLFAGVGGFRLALERLGWECVGWCEVDRFCQRVYRHRWPDGGWFWGDATTLPTAEMPDFDLLVAGFPCQSWSVAGKRRGFEDARGTLFFEIARVLRDRRPRAFLLENVKGLVCRPFRDREFRRMLEVLSGLGYAVRWRVLNSKDFGVPQNRERVFIAGRLAGRGELVPEFPWPEPRPLAVRLADVLEPEVPERYYLRGKTLRALLNHLRRHRGAGHGFGARFLDGSATTANTLSARYHKDGSENLVLAGRLEGADRPTNRVYSPEGCSPALTTPSGGRHVPMVAPFPIRFPNRNQRSFGPDVAMTVGSNTTGVAIYRHPRHPGRRCLYSPDGIHPAVRTVSRPPSPKVVGNIYPSGGEAGKVHDPSGIFSTVKQGKRGGKAGVPPVVDPHSALRVRRLTPRECERLQGFSDDWTRWGVDERGNRVEISDTQRYRMIGNAVTVPVVEALGRAVEAWLRG
ncbi:MAG: DNA (cytosine-5-)-methyltransferase [Deltaproteobacteria bacterium]|nr:DNA (cytosine-5-)-methyltransferase [Deltaproteobacteria bacterium]MBW2674022.1 DNA (cytosine-5-)-methyltransferase [Deltaproteobacteria bacterium]